MKNLKVGDLIVWNLHSKDNPPSVEIITKIDNEVIFTTKGKRCGMPYSHYNGVLNNKTQKVNDVMFYPA
jgi:hypothetical protein